MKILITGATAAQANPESHRKAANFMGLVWEELRANQTTEVFWKDPSVRWTVKDLEVYDHVFVGLASPFAMGALRFYGALSVMEKLWHSSKLTLVLDSPDPGLVTRGLRSAVNNPDSLFKSFFSNRKEYALVTGQKERARLIEQVAKMLDTKWPSTVVPAFPWSRVEEIEPWLPQGAKGSLELLNLDHLILDRFKSESVLDQDQRLQTWVYEPSTENKWLFSQNLGLPMSPLLSNHRIATDPINSKAIRESFGLLVGPTRGTTWWTPKVAVALAQGTPVMVDAWSSAQAIDPAWGHLPGPVEIMSSWKRAALAADQLQSYRKNIPGNQTAHHLLLTAAGANSTNKRKKARA